MVPLFGDMQIAPFNYLKRAPNFDSSKWPTSMSNQLSSQASLITHMESMREEHIKYVSELARHSNEVSVEWLLLCFSSKYPDCLSVDRNISLFVKVITTQREAPRTDDENRELCDLALRGLQLLSSWNVRVMELVRIKNYVERYKNV